MMEATLVSTKVFVTFLPKIFVIFRRKSFVASQTKTFNGFRQKIAFL